MKMFLISDNIDTQIGMRLAGICGVIVHTKEDLKKEFEYAIMQEDIAILFISEKLFNFDCEYIKKKKLDKYLPLIVEIPDREGSTCLKNNILSYANNIIYS
ncbi:MAG: V-type ATP synthase subunit F [Clostridiales bacterium]|jgi:V/A-type H+-transporting ATPase subunit F|nr:V-type ATP synthase subunit F [Clostridiales bacterium]